MFITLTKCRDTLKQLGQRRIAIESIDWSATNHDIFEMERDDVKAAFCHSTPMPSSMLKYDSISIDVVLLKLGP